MGTALHHDGGLYERIGMHAARMAATPQRRRCGDRKNLRDCVQIGRGLPEGKKLPHDRSWTPEQHGLPLLENRLSLDQPTVLLLALRQIGRASCRERVY